MNILDRRSWPARALDRLDDPGLTWGGVIAPLGLVYAAGVALSQLRPARPLPIPPFSIAVGNLRVGGTGKTPVVEDLARRLKEGGLEVAILSRGYRSGGGGDEPDWLRQRAGVPVILGPDRAASARQAEELGAQVVLLDDGLQSRHRARLRLALVLDRDCVSFPRPLPAGPAREGRHGLSRADAIAIRVESDPWPPTPTQWATYADWSWQRGVRGCFAFRLQPQDVLGPAGEKKSLGQLAQSGRLLLVSGLARPASFERDALRAGLPAVASLRLSDHTQFGPREAQWIEELVTRTGARGILCPEKNRERMQSLSLTQPVYALRSVVEWDRAHPAPWIRSHLPTES